MNTTDTEYPAATVEAVGRFAAWTAGKAREAMANGATENEAVRAAVALLREGLAK